MNNEKKMHQGWEKLFFKIRKSFESAKLDRKKQSKGENKDTREGNNSTLSTQLTLQIIYYWCQEFLGDAVSPTILDCQEYFSPLVPLLPHWLNQC